MYSMQKSLYADAGFIPAAIKGWLISAPVLLILGAVIINSIDAGTDTLAYVSAAVSFLSAFTAGIFAGRCAGTGRLYAGLLSAAVITLSLLTVGFLVRGSELSPDGILSVVSFTFTGVAAGCAAAPKKMKKRKGAHRR